MKICIATALAKKATNKTKPMRQNVSAKENMLEKFIATTNESIDRTIVTIISVKEIIKTLNREETLERKAKRPPSSVSILLTTLSMTAL